jgi:SAM-dependent methyltransferase
MPTLEEVQTYWQAHPAGEAEVACLASDRRDFFDERDRQTSLLYPNLDADYGFARAQGKRTLELGCGMGYNAQRLAQCGARLIVMDLAQRAVQLTRERLLLRDLSAACLVADAEHLPFAPDAFETVFSSGVIHHSPNTVQAAREIMRVLQVGGAATVMVYNRNSRWFWWNIVVVLGALMWLLDNLPARSRDRLLAVRPAWRNLIMPEGQQLRFADVLRAGTDFGGLRNPLSRVYTKNSARRLFRGLVNFRFVTQFNYFQALDENPSWSVRAVRHVLAWLDRRWGWFLIVHAENP